MTTSVLRWRLLDSLTGFAAACFRSDIAVVAIGSKPHLELLDSNLREAGFDLFSLTVSGRFLPLNARETLSQFMFNGVPDKGLFNYFLSSFSLRSRRLGKKVRVFTELAGILHGEGNHQAVKLLEQLWDEYRATAPFCFFRACRYEDLPAATNQEDLSARYSVIINDQTSLDTVWFQRFR